MPSGLYLPASAIAAALALDLALGDPPWMPHPVRLIGRAVTLAKPVSAPANRGRTFGAVRYSPTRW